MLIALAIAHVDFIGSDYPQSRHLWLFSHATIGEYAKASCGAFDQQRGIALAFYLQAQVGKLLCHFQNLTGFFGNVATVAILGTSRCSG